MISTRNQILLALAVLSRTACSSSEGGSCPNHKGGPTGCDPKEGRDPKDYERCNCGTKWHPYRIGETVYSLISDERLGYSRGMTGTVKAFSNSSVYVDFGAMQKAKGFRSVIMDLSQIDKVEPEVGVRLASRKIRGSFICTKDYSYNSGGVKVEWKKGDLVNAIEASPGAHWFREATGRYMYQGHMKSLLLPTHSFMQFSSKSGCRWQDILRASTGQLGGCYAPKAKGEERVKKTFSKVVDTLQAKGYTGLCYFNGGSQKTVFTVIKNGKKYVARVTTADGAVRHKNFEIKLGKAPELKGIVLPTVDYFEFFVSQDSGNAELYSPSGKELYVLIEIQEFVTCCDTYKGWKRKWASEQIEDLIKRTNAAGYRHDDCNGRKFDNTGITRNDECVYIDLGGLTKSRRRQSRRRLSHEVKSLEQLLAEVNAQ